MNGAHGKGVAPVLKAAREQALANCRATAGTSRQHFCTVSDSTCDKRN